EYSINPDPSIARVDVTFLLKNRTSFIIDHIHIHCIDSMSSKLLNTTNRIEFKLNLPCSQYLRKKTIDSIAFADLMSSGALICQSQLRISSSNQDFLLIINTICQSYRLTVFNFVIEIINSAASLYAETIFGQPIALLFKLIF
ncbi:unnamed protein product, partial [Rotaria sordida]